MVVKTKNSEYFVNTENKTISGGVFGNTPMKYLKIGPAMVGDRLEAVMADGSDLKTSVITYVGNGLRYGH